MFADIVFPRNNEDEFIKVASRLDIKKLYFAYDFDEYDEEKIQNKLDAINKRGIRVKTAIIVNQKNIGKAMQHSKLLIAKSSDNNRFLIESKKINLIYGFEETNRKDYLSQRASGLNHIMCELARKNNVVIGFCYSSLNKSHSSLLIGRIMQNINLCNKYKVKQVIASFSDNPFALRAPNDLISLFAVFGMDVKTAEEALSSSI